MASSVPARTTSVSVKVAGAILLSVLLLASATVIWPGARAFGDGSPPDLTIPPPATLPAAGGASTIFQHLNGVTCPTPTTCLAVGSFVACMTIPCNGTGTAQALDTIGTLSDGEWTWSDPAVLTPDSSGTLSLGSIACPDADTCIALGLDGVAGQTIYTVASDLSGAWTFSSALPVPLPPNSSFLGPLTCTSATTCMAVGGTTGATQSPYFATATLSGGTWMWLTSPMTGGFSGGSLSCPSATACIAGGGSTDGSQPTVEVGTLSAGVWAWSNPQPIPQIASEQSGVVGITCPTATTCAVLMDDAVPISSNSSQYVSSSTSTGVYDGTTWQWMPATLVSGTSTHGLANHISCSTDLHCLIVGTGPSGEQWPYAATYWTGWLSQSGSTWSTLGQDDLPLGVWGFTSDYCIDQLTCVAVGSFLPQLAASAAARMNRSLGGGNVSTTNGASTGTATIGGVVAFTSPAPDPPASIQASPRQGDALKLSWQSPQLVGRSAVTGYTATVSTGSKMKSCKTAKLTCSVKELNPISGYIVQVVAKNAEGIGPPITLPYVVFPDTSRSFSLRLASEMLVAGAHTPVLTEGAKPGSQVEVSSPHLFRLSCAANPLGQCEVSIHIRKTGIYKLTASSGSRT